MKKLAPAAIASSACFGSELADMITSGTLRIFRVGANLAREFKTVHARHFTIADNKEVRLLSQLLQSCRAVVNLIDIGEATFAQHAIHDARHRVQVVNNQHRIDVVDQGKFSPVRPCSRLASPHARQLNPTRQPGDGNLHDLDAYQAVPRRSEDRKIIFMLRNLLIEVRLLPPRSG